MPSGASTLSILEIKEFLSAGKSLHRGVEKQQPLGSINVDDPSIPASPRCFGRTVLAAAGDEICG